jgi:hypothetical protein
MTADNERTLSTVSTDVRRAAPKTGDKVKTLNTFWPPTRVRFQNTHRNGENHTNIRSH